MTNKIWVLIFSFSLLIFSANAKVAPNGLQNDSISVSITLSWNSSVSLKRSPKGKYTGELHLYAKQTDQKKTYTSTQAIAADTVASLLNQILDLGLLDMSGNDIRVIDGFRTYFTVTRMYDERKFSLVPGLTNANSEKANKILQLLYSELQDQRKLYAYLNTLPGGVYHIGMVSVKVYELAPVQGKKSSLYLSYEESFKRNRIYIPLYVINGKPIEPIELNKYESEDIKTTEVLKGSAAWAIYGMRAAHGAILLTTK